MNRPAHSRHTLPLRRPLLVATALVVTVAAAAQDPLLWAAREAAPAPIRAEEQVAAPLVALGRHDRVPAEPGGYVDIWGPLAPWEVRVLQGHGTTRGDR